MSVRPTGNVGVYVHVPFCLRHCPYCDFTVAVLRRIPHREYLRAVMAELDRRGHLLAERTVRTLYFGGGTPSLWEPSALASTIEAVRTYGSPVEITLEANPERISPERLLRWRDAGINRLSLGVQSFDDEILRRLGRMHSGEQANRAIDYAHETGFDNVSVDVIYGVPGGSAQQAVGDLERAISLGVANVSLYELTFEQRTSFGAALNDGRIQPWDDDHIVETEDALNGCLQAGGFDRYEVSSAARDGLESMHNSAYWTGDEYLGLGVGAHSLHIGDRIERLANDRNLRRYLAGQDQPSSELLAPITHLVELVMVGVRTSRGFEPAQVAERLGVDVSWLRPLVERWRSRGWIVGGSRVGATSLGMRFADTMGAEVMDAAPAGF